MFLRSAMKIALIIRKASDYRRSAVATSIAGRPSSV
jgi:hypothetical protein